MVVLTDLLINWLLISALYTLVAIGFTMIFGVGGVVNLAHGALVTIGAFSAFFVVRAGQSIWLGLLAAMLVPALFSAGLYIGLVKRVQDRPIIVMIITFLAALVVEEFFLLLIGAESRLIPPLIVGNVRILGKSIDQNRIALFVAAWVVTGILILLINRTWIGRSVKAVSMSSKGSALVGIDETNINTLTWFIAAMLAGAAGLFLGSFLSANYAMGLRPVIISFAIVIIGGLGSVKGSLIAAHIVGFAEVFTTSVIDPRLSSVTPLVLFGIVILIRPEGLYGREFAGDV